MLAKMRISPIASVVRSTASTDFDGLNPRYSRLMTRRNDDVRGMSSLVNTGSGTKATTTNWDRVTAGIQYNSGPVVGRTSTRRVRVAAGVSVSTIVPISSMQTRTFSGFRSV